MPGTDATVGVVSASPPDALIDNQQTGTSGGKPIVRQRVSSFEATGLVPFEFDSVTLLPEGSASPTTVEYRKGSTLVATLTLTYSGGNLFTVTRA